MMKAYFHMPWHTLTGLGVNTRFKLLPINSVRLSKLISRFLAILEVLKD
jgi:hypothetical protein